MKKTVVVLILLVLATSIVFGVGVKKDLRDFLLQPPNNIYAEYGYSEETLIFYNLIKLREACMEYEARLKALEQQVAELKKPVCSKCYDSNWIENLCSKHRVEYEADLRKEMDSAVQLSRQKEIKPSADVDSEGITFGIKDLDIPAGAYIANPNEVTK